MLCRRRVSRFNGKAAQTNPLVRNLYGKKEKIKMLLAALGSVRMGKNCDLGFENAALDLRPRAALSRPRSQFFPIRTDPKAANNLYIFT